MHDLIIISEGHAKTTELYLDGFKLEGVTEFELEHNVNEPPTLRLRMYLGSINSGNDVLKMLIDAGAITK